MAISRTPVLDARIDAALAASFDSGKMSADDAHRAAHALFTSRTPLRTPVLDERLVCARSEFGDPAYVDAIIRSVAALPLRTCYTDDEIEHLSVAGTGCTSGNAATIAGAAAGLKRDVMRIWRAYESDQQDNSGDEALDDLDERLRAFSSPFRDIRDRFLETTPSVRDIRSLAEHDAGDAVPTHDYNKIASDIGLPATETTRLLLRLCFMPTKRYIQAARRLGSKRTYYPAEKGNSWLFITCLGYGSSKREMSRAVRIRRFTHNVLTPLVLAGQPDEPAPRRTPTLFDLLPEGASR